MGDTLDSTFALFFKETEETHGTGTVSRVIKGELTEVVVDEAEREVWLAEERARADAYNARVDAMHRAEAEYYAEEPVG